MRPVRIPPDYRLALFRALAPRRRSRLAVIIGASASLQLGAQLAGGLPYPLGPSAVITQTGRDTIEPGA